MSRVSYIKCAPIWASVLVAKSYSVILSVAETLKNITEYSVVTDPNSKCICLRQRLTMTDRVILSDHL